MPPRVTVVIPTQRRPEGLRRAVRSVLRQDLMAAGDIEIVIVDNDEVPSARLAVESLRQEAGPMALHYRHEPRPGVSSARNAAMELARGPFIAFLDDDEEASGIWLAELLSAQRRLAADVVFGPIRGRAPEGVAHQAFLEDFFSRKGPPVDSLAEKLYGCGNSLLRRDVLPDPKAPFNLAYDARGGEDDHLFRELRARGARFGWAAAALVFEDPEPSRLTLSYALRRAFAYGQGGTQFRSSFGSPGLVAWSMGTGLCQFAAYGILGAASMLLRLRGRAFLLDRAARGLGKFLWGPPFHIRFYGRLAKDAPPAQAAGAGLRGGSALTG